MKQRKKTGAGEEEGGGRREGEMDLDGNGDEVYEVKSPERARGMVVGFGEEW